MRTFKVSSIRDDDRSRLFEVVERGVHSRDDRNRGDVVLFRLTRTPWWSERRHRRRVRPAANSRTVVSALKAQFS